MAKRVMAGIVALVVASLVTASAQAATLHLGSPLTANFIPGSVGGQQVTIVQRSLPEPGVNIVNPVDGHVVSFQLGPSSGTFALQVVRFNDTQAASIATSPLMPIQTTGVTAPIPVDLPIKRGDLIGIKVQNASDLLAGAQNGSAFSVWSPALDDGAAARDADFGRNLVEFGVGATVRYCQVPKLKGKTPQAARATLARSDCTAGKTIKTKQTRRRRSVISQSVPPGRAVSDTAPIALRISRAGGSRR